MRKGELTRLRTALASRNAALTQCAGALYVREVSLVALREMVAAFGSFPETKRERDALTKARAAIAAIEAAP